MEGKEDDLETPWLCVSSFFSCAINSFTSKILGLEQRLLVKLTRCFYGFVIRNLGTAI